ncbi:MAG: RluA family pseudouridine synthase [Lachnospiraceae bacterium]|nr:RluA family pseudouridine synthase [Lachnospiraceae bacterium]
MRIKILYEDEDILVVHKPAGLAVQTAHVGQQDVESELKNYLISGATKASPYVGIIHRLDQPVEGLLVFAKTRAAAADLNRQLQHNAFCKEYLAVVCGKPADTERELMNYLLKDKGRALVFEQKDKLPAEAKQAVLHYQMERERETAAGMISLLRIKLETGRFHQIRAQLSHAGFPILGDSKYGSEISGQMSGTLGIRHTALCACRLRFYHPASGQEMEYTVHPDNPAFSFFDTDK